MQSVFKHLSMSRNEVLGLPESLFTMPGDTFFAVNNRLSLFPKKLLSVVFRLHFSLRFGNTCPLTSATVRELTPRAKR